MALEETGISVALVQQTIGESSGDVMTLCRSTNIKRWSKHKPFRSLTLFHATVAAMEADMNSTDIGDSAIYRWGLSVRCGFNADFVDLYSSMWQWDKPTNRGRLGDFRRYDHTATEGPMPYLSILSSEIEVEEDTSGETECEYKATIPIYIPTNDHDLKLSDFSFTYNGTTFNLSQCRIGCFVRMEDAASIAITDTSYVAGNYYGSIVNLTVGVTYEQLDVNCYICPLLTWGTTSLRFQMDKVQTVKFSYTQPGPTPVPALIDAYHTEEPSYTWDLSTQTITFQYEIGYKNTGDLAATTQMQIRARFSYRTYDAEQVLLRNASPLAAHTSGSIAATRSYTLLNYSAEEPEIYYEFLDENGSWDTVRVLGE